MGGMIRLGRYDPNWQHWACIHARHAKPTCQGGKDQYGLGHCELGADANPWASAEWHEREARGRRLIGHETGWAEQVGVLP